MISQATPKDLAGNISNQEQKSMLVGTIGKFLTSAGIAVDLEKLLSQLESVDIAGGDQKGILQAISSYISDEDAQRPLNQSSEIMEQAKDLLGTALPGLGIEVPLASDADGPSELPKAPSMKATTLIGDVHLFKAALSASAGAKSVKDLSAFEESEPKL